MSTLERADRIMTIANYVKEKVGDQDMGKASQILEDFLKFERELREMNKDG